MLVVLAIAMPVLAQPAPPLRALLTAARAGDVAAIRAALAAGADVNGRDPRYGQTALMRAGMFGQPAATAALLQARARTDIAAVDGRTAMHWAAIGGSADVVALLVKAGAAVNIETHEETPLGLAVQAGSLASVTALLAAGARPDAMRPAVASAINTVLGNRRTGEALEICRALIRTRRGLDRPDEQGRPAVVVVADWAHQADAAAFARELLAAGASPATKGPDGRSALDIVRQKMTTERDPDYRRAVEATLAAFEGRARP